MHKFLQKCCGARSAASNAKSIVPLYLGNLVFLLKLAERVDKPVLGGNDKMKKILLKKAFIKYITFSFGLSRALTIHDIQ